MKKLLQEIIDFRKYGNCLEVNLYEEYKKYLIEQILKEFTTKQLYDVFLNVFHKKETLEQRLEKIIKQFNNTKFYNIDPETKERKESGRTNLQLGSGNFCNKPDFESEFLDFEFTDIENNKKAKKFLKELTDLFDEKGWLRIDSIS